MRRKLTAPGSEEWGGVISVSSRPATPTRSVRSVIAALPPAGIFAGSLIVASAAATHPSFLGPPLLSPDVATYLAYARLGVLHGLDPYTHAAHALPASDPLHPWVTGQAGATNYGPPFTLLTYLLAHLSVAAGIWVLKVVAALASLATVALVASCARLRGVSPVRAAVLVALNPVALVYAVGGDHNDLWMM